VASRSSSRVARTCYFRLNILFPTLSCLPNANTAFSTAPAQQRNHRAHGIKRLPSPQVSFVLSDCMYQHQYHISLLSLSFPFLHPTHRRLATRHVHILLSSYTSIRYRRSGISSIWRRSSAGGSQFDQQHYFVGWDVEFEFSCGDRRGESLCFFPSVGFVCVCLCVIWMTVEGRWEKDERESARWCLRIGRYTDRPYSAYSEEGSLPPVDVGMVITVDDCMHRAGTVCLFDDELDMDWNTRNAEGRYCRRSTSDRRKRGHWFEKLKRHS
jgi:hypothetical protein